MTTWSARLASILFALVAPLGGAAEAGEALAARLSIDDAANVVEIAVTERPAFKTFTLANPPRVVVDFAALDWRFEAPRPGGAMKLIDGLRLGRSPEGRARMVIDLRAPAAIEAAFTSPGEPTPRFTLRLSPVSEDAFAAAADVINAAKGRAPVPRPRPKRHVVIAIDAGHGGRDAGASYGDLKEKDLVYDYALRLKEVIEGRPGFRAVFTRQGDDFVRLRERVARARRANADLMISIHADALPRGNASGASVFTLSEEASSAEAAELVASHNRADAIGGVSLDAAESDVAQVLVDLARRQTDSQSETLAATIADALEARAEVLRGRALQSADFRVLKAPDIPSVLVEIGFLSAARDRARLTSPEGRDAIVTALAEGVFAWVSRQTGPRYSAARRGG